MMDIFVRVCVCVCVCLSDCVFDLCAEQGSAELRCASYEAYAAACQEAGVQLGPWRQQLDCGKMFNTLLLMLYFYIVFNIYGGHIVYNGCFYTKTWVSGLSYKPTNCDI